MDFKTVSLFQRVFPKKYVERIKASPLSFRLAKGGFWSIVGAVISRGLGFLSFLIVARVLGKEGFGELGIIQSTVGMFGVLAGFGLGLTATKHVAQYRVKNSGKAGRIIALLHIVAIISGSVIAIILIILAPWLASNMLAAPHLSKYLQIGAGLLFLNTLTGVQTGVLSGFEAFKTIAEVNLWSGIASFPLIAIGVYTGGLSGAVWGMIVGACITWFLNKTALWRIAIKENVYINFKKCWQESYVLLEFSIPIFLSGTMTGLITWVCNALLVNQNNGYAELGIFNAANTLRVLLMFFPSLVIQAAFPILSAHYITYEFDPKFKQILAFTHNSINLPLIIVSIIIMFFPNLFMNIYGHGFGNEPLVLVALMISTIVQGLGTTVGSTMQAKGDVWFGFLLNSVWGIFLISFVYITVSAFKAAAVALGYAIAYLLLLIFQIIRLRNDLPEQLKSSIFKGLFLTVIVAVIAIVLNNIQNNLIIKISFAIIIIIAIIKYKLIAVETYLF